MNEPPLASCLVRVTQTVSACLKDSCKSSELSNPPGRSTGAREKCTQRELRSVSSLVLPARDGPRRTGTRQSLSLHALAVLWGYIWDCCSELNGGRSTRTFCVWRNAAFLFCLFEFQPAGVTLSLLWEMVPLKSGELGLGHLGSPLASSVGRHPFILNASGFRT